MKLKIVKLRTVKEQFNFEIQKSTLLSSHDWKINITPENQRVDEYDFSAICKTCNSRIDMYMHQGNKLTFYGGFYPLDDIINMSCSDFIIKNIIE